MTGNSRRSPPTTPIATTSPKRCRCFEKHAAPFAIYVAPSLINGTPTCGGKLIEDIVAARDFVTCRLPTGRVTLDCSTGAKKYAANVYLHDYLTRQVREEDQRDVVRDLARSVGVDFEKPRARR